MKKLAFLGGAAGLGLMALLGAPITQAADHLDATALATSPMGDINDVYAWMTDSGANVSLAMTVSPLDDGTHEFGSSVQYVFHLTRFEAFPTGAADFAAGEEAKVICTFASATEGECWVVDPSNKVIDYVKGDFSAEAGATSADGKLKVFAGQRSDPFFFNFAGFSVAKQAFITNFCGGGNCPIVLRTPPSKVDAAGCPKALPAQVKPIAAQIGMPVGAAVGPCPANSTDCFATYNVMAIVVDLDKTLVTTDAKPLLGVWGSTHATP